MDTGLLKPPTLVSRILKHIFRTNAYLHFRLNCTYLSGSGMCPDMGETPHPHQTHPAPTQSSLPVHIRFSLTSGGPTTSAGSLSGVFTGLGGSSTGGAGPGGGSLAAAASSAVIGAVPATTTPRDRGLPPPRFDEDVQLPLIKVAVLGAAGVGKTSLIKVRKLHLLPILLLGLLTCFLWIGTAVLGVSVQVRNENRGLNQYMHILIFFVVPYDW